MRRRILVVDDDQAMCELLESDLSGRGFDVDWRVSAHDAFLALPSAEYDVALTDLNMPDMSGIDLCERIVANRPDLPVVVITAFGSLDTAVAALRAGAYDFVTKPFDMELLALALKRAAEHRDLQEKVKRLGETVEQSQRFEQLLGASPAMRKLFDELARVADADASVLIVGESGTGKELVARALHERSERSGGPFVAINCAALPDNLLEAELFGHTRGAFTDARAGRKGLLLQGNGGTVLLDEIGDLPLALQPKLLRALEERRVRPVGGDEELPFDVRIIASTNHDLESAVEAGRFREDLYFRVNVITIKLPPLRSRGTDVLLLARHFLDRFAAAADKRVTGIADAAAERLLSYTWPGNVRELRNALERAVALTRYEQLTVDDLPETIRAYRSSHVVVAGDDPSELASMEEVERRYIEHVLKAVGGNKTLAAQVLGFDRKTLYRKLASYEIASDSNRR
jgi:two-component system response regulator HydG